MTTITIVLAYPKSFEFF